MSEKAKAYGGIVISGERLVLVREVKNHYGGAAWTFPKGRPDQVEEPEQTALRETLEETGVRAEIVERIPGEFEGTVTVTAYFLMQPVVETGEFGEETVKVRWVDPVEAERLIRWSIIGVADRDLAALAAALLVYDATKT